MVDRKMLTLVERLHTRTISGVLPWSETREDGVFQADFGGLSLTIGTRADPQFPDAPDYVIRILNQEGRLVEEFSNNDLSPLASGGGPNPYKLMSEIFGSARRTAMGVEEALNELLNELDDEPS